MLHKWSGSFIEFVQCEILLHFAYMLTFIFLMIKSRFISVGTDYTQQFQPTNLGYLADRIVKNVHFFGNDKKTKLAKHKVMKYHVDKRKIVEVDGINIIVCFKKDHFNYAYDRFYFMEDKIIEPSMACQFIE